MMSKENVKEGSKAENGMTEIKNFLIEKTKESYAIHSARLGSIQSNFPPRDKHQTELDGSLCVLLKNAGMVQIEFKVSGEEACYELINRVRDKTNYGTVITKEEPLKRSFEIPEGLDKELEALHLMLKILEDLDEDARERVFKFIRDKMIT